MIKTLCAKFRKQNHPNNTLLLKWATFLSHFRPILHDLKLAYIYNLNRVLEKELSSHSTRAMIPREGDDREDRRGAVQTGGVGR